MSEARQCDNYSILCQNISKNNISILYTLIYRKWQEKCTDKFHEIQRNKMEVSTRVMFLCEIEHTQQVVDFARVEFQKFCNEDDSSYIETNKELLQLKEKAKCIKDKLEEKLVLGRNLYERNYMCEKLVNEILKEIINLLNYFLKSKGALDVTPKVPFVDKDLFIKLKTKFNNIYEGDDNDPSIFYWESLLSLFEDTFDYKDKKFITEESEMDYIYNEGSEPLCQVYSIIDILIKQVIPSIPERKENEELVSFSKSSFNIEDENLLMQEAIDERREKEQFFNLQGEHLKVPRDLSPAIFVRQRVNVIGEILKKHDKIIKPMYIHDK